MNSFDTLLLQMEHAQDQDIAQALAWWKSHSPEAKNAIWNEIQKPQPNAVAEVVSRFAQIGMTMIALMVGKDAR